MFEWMIIFCLASDFQGRPVNQCFGLESAEKYLSELECQMVMRHRTDWLMTELSQSSDGRSPVVTGICGKSDAETL